MDCQGWCFVSETLRTKNFLDSGDVVRFQYVCGLDDLCRISAFSFNVVLVFAHYPPRIIERGIKTAILFNDGIQAVQSLQ